MVNYWMIIGRAATSTEVRKAVQESLPPRAYRIDVNRRSFRFSRDEYQLARDVVRRGLEAAGLVVVPMSLIELGELLYASCYQEVHESLSLLSEMMKRYDISAKRQPLFYSALGLAIVDQEAARMFRGGHFKEAMFDGLTDDDCETLRKVLSDHELQKHTSQLSRICWEPDCTSKGFDLVPFVMPAPSQIIPGMVVNHKPKYGGGGE